MKFTKSALDGFRPAEKERLLFDEAQPGFGLRIAPTGRKSFFIQYRANGRTRRLALGKYGVLSLAQAKAIAKVKLVEVAQGADPSAERHRSKSMPTLAQVCERFFEEHAKHRCKPSTQKEYRRCIDLFIIPALGMHRIHQVTRSHVSELHFLHRETPYQANRTLGVLSVIFNQSEVWELRPDGSNPTRHIKRYKEEKRERFLSPEELARLGSVLTQAEKVGTETSFVVAAFRLLILTGCRLSEIQKLRWDEVDLLGGRLLLKDSKTGAKPVYLGKAALDILAPLPGRDNNTYVIKGQLDGNHVTDLQKPWRRIRTSANIQDVRIHDLRHSHASFAVSLGEGLPMIGKLLGHSNVATTARYAHLADAAIRDAATRLDAKVGKMLG